MRTKLSLKSYFHREKFDIIREILLSVLISTIVTSLFAFYFEKKIDRRVADRQFIYDFSRTFADNPKYRNVSVAIEDQYLYGKEDKMLSISDYDLDDYLGLLSDMWIYSENNLISKELFSNQYYYYLCVTYHSKYVKDYRNKLQTQGFSDNWIFLDDVAEKLNLDHWDCKK